MQETPSCRTTPEHPLRHTCSFAWISLLRFARSIKGKVNSKYVSGDWKERGCFALLSSTSHVERLLGFRSS